MWRLLRILTLPVLLVGAIGYTLTTSTEPSADATAAASAGPARLLAQLPVRAERGAGYDRDAWRHWIDADGDGCDTRREVLIAEATNPPQVGENCWIEGGTWVSLYDQVRVDGYPAEFDVDHLVALAEAHASGGWRWSAARRQAYANDVSRPHTLIAVTASTNRSKSDRDPAEWLPPDPSTHCGYAADWVRVKHRWKLSVDPAEQRALATILAGCPSNSTLTR